MKVCIPIAEKNGLDSKVYEHFGSAKYFIIYNLDDDTYKIADNINDHTNHGECTSITTIKSFNVDAVLTGGMGQRAIQKFNNSGIKVYRLASANIKEAIDIFKKENINEMDVNSGCSGHH